MGSAMQIARFSRLIAKAIDLFIALLVSLLLYPWGILIGMFYIGISDSLQKGQSIGKKIIGFNVVSLIDGKPCLLKQSIIRNLPFSIPLFFLLIPIWGWFFSFALGIPLVALEIYLIFNIDTGHRLGDVMADTTVIADDPNRLDIQKRKTSWFRNSPSTL